MASLASLDSNLDGHKLAKGMCLARKTRDKSVNLVRAVNFSVLN